MIWFNCKQCGKTHGRPDNLAGTLVFCECGHGNRVPWNSTAPAQEIPDAEPAPPPQPRAPERAPAPPAYPPSAPLPPRKVRERLRIRPEYCLQHDETPSTEVCADCKMRFCSACVVTLQGRTLCGPCKNFRIRALSQPPRILPLAIISLILALTAGPVTLVLSFLAVGLSIQEGATGVAVLLCVLALALPTVGLVLGGMALRQIETQAFTGGRALAASGSVASLVSVLWAVTIAVVLVCKEIRS
jgi:hypothetical protein